MFHNNDKAASIVGREWLESLPNGNSLKPAMWAEQKEKPERFGVSVAVSSFVRSFFLYIKLRQLRRTNNNEAVKLEDVNAYQRMNNNPRDKSKYNEVTKPCVSCQIVFDGFKSFNYLGNCAEYDVIQTKELDALLIKEPWNVLERYCQKQFDAFKKLSEKVEAGEDSAPAEEASQENGVPAEEGSQENVSAEKTSQENEVPAEKTSQENEVPAEKTSQKNEVPAEKTSQENEVPAEEVLQENEVSAEELSQENEEIKTYYNEIRDAKSLKYAWNNKEKAFKLKAIIQRKQNKKNKRKKSQ